MSANVEIFDLDLAAEFLGVSSKTLSKMFNAGEIPGFRVGAQIRFRKDRLLEWTDQKAKEQEAKQ